VLPRWVWRLGRFVARNRALWILLAPVARLPHWRLGILIAHGFWFDTSKLRRIYPGPLRTVPEGMRALRALDG
jgi:hypothetical protein